MNEERLRQAARRAGEAIVQNLPEPEDCTHDFSTDPIPFRRPSRRMRPALRAACLLLVCLLGCGVWLRVDVQAWEVLQGWVREQAATVQRYVFAGELDQEKVEDGRYLLPYVPEGYQARSAYLADFGASLTYRNAAGQTLTFGYLKRDTVTVSSSISFHTGGMERTTVTVKDRRADFYQGEGNILVWQTRETLFFLDGALSEAELIALAEGVTYEP